MGRALSYERRNEACVFHLSKDPVSVIPDTFAIKRNAPMKAYIDKMWVPRYIIIITVYFRITFHLLFKKTHEVSRPHFQFVVI